MSFSALVVVGDAQGRVGYGRGRGKGISTAIAKATASATKDMRMIQMHRSTIPHDLRYSRGSTTAIILPLPAGRGIIAGKSARSVFQAAGIQDVCCKIHGSTNPSNVVRTVIQALQSLRSIFYYARKRDLSVQDLVPSIGSRESQILDKVEVQDV